MKTVCKSKQCINHQRINRHDCPPSASAWSPRPARRRASHRVVSPRNWAIGNAALSRLAVKYDMKQAGYWIVGTWLKTKSELWLKGGLALGEDHVFDFSQGPALVKGDMTLCLPMIDFMYDVSTSIRAQTYRQCTKLVFDGLDPDQRVHLPEQAHQELVTLALHAYSAMPDRPLMFVSSLQFVSAYFVDETTISHVMHVFAEGLPNLLRLELFNANCPIDLMLNHADALIRRSLFPGKLLQNLSVSVYLPDPRDDALPLSSPRAWKLAGAHHPRSPLGPTYPKSQLDSLELEIKGPGLAFMDSRHAATVAIHPEILRQLTSLMLRSVQLSLPPPHFAQPDSPSFMPLAHLPTSVGLNRHLTLANMDRFIFTSNAMVLPRIIHPPSRHMIVDALPHMPALTQLGLAVDCVHSSIGKQFSTALVAPVVRRFPALVCARFANLTAKGSEAQRAMAIEDEFFKPFPRELSACPRLRGVWVNEEAPVEYYSWMEKQRRILG